jgi:hypothetical protein
VTINCHRSRFRSWVILQFLGLAADTSRRANAWRGRGDLPAVHFFGFYSGPPMTRTGNPLSLDERERAHVRIAVRPNENRRVGFAHQERITALDGIDREPKEVRDAHHELPTVRKPEAEPRR